MKHAEFESRIKNGEYQVFLFSSPCSLPASFARHHWFITNNKGVVKRWEILFRTYENGPVSEHFSWNHLKPTDGMEVFLFTKKLLWPSHLRGFIEGGEGSVAQRMIEFIENSHEQYPYPHHYSLIGPNSNTYIKWILDKFPEFEAKLSWNSFGKNYRVPSAGIEPTITP